MVRRAHELMLHGSAEMRSPWFSSEWRLTQGGREIAEMRRHARMHVSTVTFAEGERWLLEPQGWGVVRAMDSGETEIARVVRRSWIGRRWELTAPAWAYELVSDPLPRRWHFAVGNVAVAQIAGSLFSYNRVRIDTTLAVPVAAVMLAWHVIARPWEAAAAPAGLVPAAQPQAGGQRPAPGPA